MKLATIIIGAVLAAGHCCLAKAAEQEFQITPRVGLGELRLKPGVITLDVPQEVDTGDFGVGFAFVTPIGLMLEVGLQLQTNLLDPGGDAEAELTLLERYVAAGFQLELGSGFRLTPKVGRIRWRLRSEEDPLFNFGDEESIDGYEDFWEVSFTKNIADTVAMGLRYRSTDYDFGRAESAMFVTTFGFR